MALTKRQRQLLDLIADFRDEQGYCPSYEEIAHGLQLASLATVHKHIIALDRKGYLKRGFNQSRSLELTPQVLTGTAAHAAGRAAAGAHRGRCAGGSHGTKGRAAFADFRRQRQHLCPRGPWRFHDRGPHLRRRSDPAGADSGSARRRHRGGAGGRKRRPP